MNFDPHGVFSASREQLPALWHAARAEGVPEGVATPKTPTVGRDARSRTLQHQILWDSVKVRWEGIQFNATVQDGQSTLALEPGGSAPEGTITLVTSKAWFGKKFPTTDSDTELEIQIPGSSKWATFNITGVAGVYDITDDQITIVAEFHPNP
jgi:hypothetical protein